MRTRAPVRSGKRISDWIARSLLRGAAEAARRQQGRSAWPIRSDLRMPRTGRRPADRQRAAGARLRRVFYFSLLGVKLFSKHGVGVASGYATPRALAGPYRSQESPSPGPGLSNTPVPSRWGVFSADDQCPKSVAISVAAFIGQPKNWPPERSRSFRSLPGL